jgi:transposase
MLFPAPRPSSDSRPLPDWPTIQQELKKKGVTLALLWEEYKAVYPEGYQYSQFCELYRRWRGTLKVWMRQEHKAGEKLFVDYSGKTVDIVDPVTGEMKPAQIFTAVLGASNYTYAEATWTQSLPDWIGSHQRAFDYFGGVSELVIPDNLRSGVSKACRYDPDINPTYQDLANHYKTAILPARSGKPRDKAKAEAGVLLVQRWILAALRNRIFFSLTELNEAMAELLEKLNNKPFKKLPGSRKSQFESLDKPALKPLPQSPYQYAQWEKARVNIDYHIEIDHHYYSLPYQLVGKKLDVRITSKTIECFHKGRRVASHQRIYNPWAYTTLPEHMPRSHQEYLKWTPDRLLNWASKIGPSTARLAQNVMDSKAHPQQGFRTILGILRLEKTYGAERLEAACQRALYIKAASYRSVASILKNGLDIKRKKESEDDSPPLRHSNIRGAEYYSSGKGEDNAESSDNGQAKSHEALGHGQGLGGTDGLLGHQLPLIR